MTAVKDDAVLIIVNVGRILESPLTSVNRDRNDPAIVTMAEVVEHLYGREYKGKVVIDDAIKAAIDAYYEQYGA